MKTLNHAQVRLLEKAITTCRERWSIENIEKLIVIVELVTRHQSFVRRMSEKLIKDSKNV